MTMDLAVPRKSSSNVHTSSHTMGSAFSGPFLRRELANGKVSPNPKSPNGLFVPKNLLNTSSDARSLKA
ncbi:hypothetical protein GN958_ATG13852 [Phytophthora infestans]|uniref:Uncharacterized protein n=1 Tax=Phytophthora infestans TaxID=4787 RepID=A0A8S9U793_PHYIN|nr:hypothetical protein GN958_ATG13852 [Phytophthora infestans]